MEPGWRDLRPVDRSFWVAGPHCSPETRLLSSGGLLSARQQGAGRDPANRGRDGEEDNFQESNTLLLGPFPQQTCLRDSPRDFSDIVGGEGGLSARCVLPGRLTKGGMVFPHCTTRRTSVNANRSGLSLIGVRILLGTFPAVSCRPTKLPLNAIYSSGSTWQGSPERGSPVNGLGVILSSCPA
jgi:hypothetical protein